MFVCGPLQPLSGAATTGPESEWVKAFATRIALRQRRAVLALEIPVPNGKMDLGIISLTNRALPRDFTVGIGRTFGCLGDRALFRLAAMRPNQVYGPDAIERLIPAREVRYLVSMGMIRATSGGWSRRHLPADHIRSIRSYEFKLNRGNRGVTQAALRVPYSSESWLVLNASARRNLSTSAMTQARQRGVGLIDGDSHEAVLVSHRRTLPRWAKFLAGRALARGMV